MQGTWWPRVFVIVGLAAMVIGAVDPLEGSLVILPGAVVAAIGALLGKGRHRTMLYWAVALVAIGVAALFGLSAIGGFGGTTGRSMWWALLLLPYPVGWVTGLVGAIRTLRERRLPA